MSTEPKPSVIPYHLLLIYVLLAFGIMVVGYLYYMHQKTQYLNHEKNNLMSIARLKIGQIENWRHERLGDAEVIFHNRIIADLVGELLHNPGRPELKEEIVEWMDARKKHYGYREVFLLDARGKTVLSVGAGNEGLQRHSKEMAMATMKSRKIMFTDFHRDGIADEIHLGLIIPIFFHEGRPLGCFLLIIDPKQFLYPLIQTWPVPSGTAETLLVRREGADVLFLNELRHRKDTALSLRFPLSKKDLPASMAVLGAQGLVEGNDYRGKPVIASVAAIPYSPWFIVAKVDKDEVYGPLRGNALVVSAIIMVLIIASGLGIALWWRQQTVLFYRGQYEKEVEYNTERERVNKELQRSNEELKQFAYIASHDLQEPLRMIASFLQLIERRYKGKLDKDADEFISFAVEGASRLQNMIIGLLAYSRVETKGKPFEEINCSEALGNAISNLRIAIDESGAMITTDRLPVVKADAGQLIQVFQNLIANAVKFRREDPPRIHVSAVRKEDEWVFSVRDNGIGIAPDYKDRIFNIFQRLHGREYPGVGIGLSLCRRIIERHGGSIWFESEAGKGTTFYFTIPIKEDKTT